MEAFPSIIFDSHEVFFRSPQGAIPAGNELRLRILVSAGVSPRNAFVRLWRNGKEELLPMVQGEFLHNSPWGIFLQEYQLSINVSRETTELLWYLFRVDGVDGSLFCVNGDRMLGGRGVVKNFLDTAHSFQITVTKEDFHTPDWAKGAVMYQIFPDRFAPSGKFFIGKGQKKHPSWQEEPDYLPDPNKGYYAACDFFGGTIRGIFEKLDYLASLHVQVLYLNPIFQAFSNHRYDTGDYEKVDPILGSEEDLRCLCKEAEKRGMRILLDGVFSHTGSNSKYFNRESEYPSLGAYQSKDSSYAPWYQFRQFPDDYDCWWGVWSLPNVNELEPSYLDYIVRDKNSIVRRWLRAGISGWRLDVADELPDGFIKELRQAVKEENPDALLLGEVWEDASSKVSYGVRRQFLMGNELDTVMNYPLRASLIAYLKGEIDAQDFCDTVLSLQENYPTETFACLMNMLSTHDTERSITKLGGAPDKKQVTRQQQAEFRLDELARLKAEALEKLGALILYSLPGMPCIYYGDEAGLEGYEDPFNRRTFPWGNENGELLDWYRRLGALRGKTLRSGTLSMQGDGDLLFIQRVFKGEVVIILVNPVDEPVETVLDRTAIPGIPTILLSSTESAELTQRESGFDLFLPPRSGIVVKVNVSRETMEEKE